MRGGELAVECWECQQMANMRGERNGEWRFAAIGDAFEDKSIVNTIVRVIKDYSKQLDYGDQS